ncbi:MAG: CAP domain-containing protein [Leptospiraceae bacterium]|nr:CAP domain-containing protein [Leptospiraceae bacterium]
MKKQLSFLILPFCFFLSNCITNLQECPVDTIKLETECSSTKRKYEADKDLLTLTVIGSSLASTYSGTLSGNALEFYNILVAYRANGTYTSSNGTNYTFSNSSKCSGTTSDNGALNRAAQKHTENMILYNLFSHTGYDGTSPTDRVKAEGLNVGAGENIAAGQTTAESVFNSWWNSSGHRSNMENCNYTHVGIGYANKNSINANADYSVYWTNVFATIN